MEIDSNRHSISDLLFAAKSNTTPPPIALTNWEHLRPTASGRTPSGYQTTDSDLPDSIPAWAVIQKEAGINNQVFQVSGRKNKGILWNMAIAVE